MFCAPGLVLNGTEGVGSRFLVLRAQTHFRQYRRRRIPFSCFARPDSFSAVPRASCPVFMSCAPGLVFKGTEGVGSRFHVLCSRTGIRRYRGRRVSFSCFALSESFSAMPKATDTVFKFCGSGLVFGGTKGVGSNFHVLRVRNRFWRCGGRRVLFSCFVLPDSFSTVSSESGPVFMFCNLGLVFGGTEGVGSRFHVLHALTHFRPNRGRWVPFPCFARPDSFLALPRGSGPVFMFHAPVIVFAEGVGSRFHFLRARTRFWRYRGRRVPFSCFALQESFSALPSASGPVFTFCAPGLVFGGT
jgi:hypothetical protein